MGRPAVILAVVALAVAWVICPGGADGTILRQRHLRRAGVAADAPEGWGFSTQTGYPSIVLLLVHPDGSKLSLARGQTRAPNGVAFADQNRAALRASKLRIEAEAEGERGTKTFDLRPEGGEQRVRQLYFVRRPKAATSASRPDAGAPSTGERPVESPLDMNEGYLATLTTTDGLLSAHAHDLVVFVDSLAFDEDD